MRNGGKRGAADLGKLGWGIGDVDRQVCVLAVYQHVDWAADHALRRDL